jgi:diguanylate cyclase (GGDEF)-like protein
LPLVVFSSVFNTAQATTAVELVDGALCALIMFGLWIASWMLDERIVVKIDIAAAATIWTGLLSAAIQAGGFHSAGAMSLLTMSLFWAPAIAVYWGMVFHERWFIGVAQVVLYYFAFFIIDVLVMLPVGKPMFVHGWFLALAQGVLLVSMMAIFANITAQMKVSEARWRTAEHRANHDPLTGLLNRRTFSRHLPNVVHLASSGQLDLSLMLIDFDHFKSINDRYGHSAGDTVLRKIAKVFASSLRAGDSLYRWGGEEFAIILRDTDAATVALIAERLREKTEKHSFGLKRSVTVSIGVATYEMGESPEDFFKRGDAAMLAAKRNGRNRVETAQSGPRPDPAAMRESMSLVSGTNG